MDCGLSLRPAAEGDADLLFGWRNDPVTVEFSGTSRRVRYREHLDWFASSLAAPSTHIWIAEQDVLPVGQVRVDEVGGAYRVSIAVDPAWRNRGKGRALLVLLLETLRQLSPSGVAVAEVASGNGASQRIFLAAGFEATKVDGPMLEYRYNW